MATTAAALSTPVRQKRSWRRRSQPYLYLLPALAVMALITFYPLGYQVWMSFTDFGLKNFRVNNPVAPTFVGLDNYTRIATSQLQIPNFEFLRLVLFNLWWAFSNVVLHVIIGVLVAVVLNTPGLLFRGFYRALFILPVVIPSLIVATVWRNMFDTDAGAINFLLQTLGGIVGLPADLPAFHLDWLRQADDPIPFIPLPLAYFAMLTANTWLGWPLNAVVATGALQSIPGDLYEAADMDGANSWQKFRTVTIPFLRPAMLPYAIYGFVVTFNLFFLSYFMTQGEPFGRTEILVTQAYRLAQERQLLRRRRRLLRLPVLPVAGRDPDHEPPGEGDQELCRLTARHDDEDHPMTAYARRPPPPAPDARSRPLPRVVPAGGASPPVAPPARAPGDPHRDQPHRAVPGRVDHLDLGRPTRPVPARRPQPDPARRDDRRLPEGHRPAHEQPDQLHRARASTASRSR